MSKSFVFYVDGMTCGSCKQTLQSYVTGCIEDTLHNQLKNIHADMTTLTPVKVVIELATDTVPEKYQATWNTLHDAINEIFVCRSYDYSLSQESLPPENNWLAKALRILNSHWFLGAIGCSAGIALLIACLAAGGLPLALMIPVALVSTVLTLALGANSYYDAWKKLTTSGTLTMDSLFAISTLSVLIVSLSAFFVPWLPMMFDAGLLIYGFRHIGIAIENSIKAKTVASRFQDRAPKKVNLWVNNALTAVAINEIQPGAIIIVKPGDIIPLDGICDNESSIYDTNETGTGLPRFYRTGKQVLAGMQVAPNATMPLRIKVTKNVKESRLARRDAGIDQSILEKAPLEIKTEQLLTYFIPTVIALAIGSGIIIGIFFPPALAIQCAISVLVSACPCTLGLVIPLAIKTGMHKGAAHDVLFKNAEYLQQAELIDTVVFDLNGTLTTGIPAIKNYAICAEAQLSPKEFFKLCASLEKNATHPTGKAIHAYAQQFGAEHYETPTIHAHHAGFWTYINNDHYCIGGLSLMRQQNIDTQSLENNVSLAAGDNLIFIARNQQIIGYIITTDSLRKDALHTVNTLKKMGKEVHICTGTDELTAARYAAALGITHVKANCAAYAKNNNDHNNKPQYIRSLQKQGRKVAMIGDAGNDANALAASDLGMVIVSKGSDKISEQNAGALILNGHLLPIAHAFGISEQTVSNIKQNLGMSLGYNLCAILIAGGLLVALGITLNPAVGVALMAVQACIILANVYRFKQESLPHLAEQHQELSKTTGESSFAVINKNLPHATVKSEHSATPNVWHHHFWTQTAQRIEAISNEAHNLLKSILRV